MSIAHLAAHDQIGMGFEDREDLLGVRNLLAIENPSPRLADHPFAKIAIVGDLGPSAGILLDNAWHDADAYRYDKPCLTSHMTSTTTAIPTTMAAATATDTVFNDVEWSSRSVMTVLLYGISGAPQARAQQGGNDFSSSGNRMSRRSISAADPCCAQSAVISGTMARAPASAPWRRIRVASRYRRRRSQREQATEWRSRPASAGR